jgi:hypothetical protein
MVVVASIASAMLNASVLSDVVRIRIGVTKIRLIARKLDHLVVSQMIKKTFFVSTWSINQLTLVVSEKKKARWYDTYARKRWMMKETKEDNYGQCIHIATDQSFSPFNKIRFIFYSPRKSHIPNKRHEVVSFPIFTTTFSTSKLPIYGDDSLAR